MTSWRLLRTPRWIVRTLLALVAIAVFVAASVWQFQRTQEQRTVARAAIAQPASYETVLPPEAGEIPLEGLGRQVLVSGTAVPGARSFVRDRLSPSGLRGFWLVDGVRVADGRLVAVLQGWVERPAQTPPAPAGEPVAREVRLLGRLQPDENFYTTAPKPASGPLLTITGDGLSRQWSRALGSGGLAPGYVTLTGTPVAPGVEPVQPVIGSDPDVSFPLQNAFYSLQWLIFAGIVAVIWVRWLREEAQEESTAGKGADPAVEHVR